MLKMLVKILTPGEIETVFAVKENSQL